MKELSIGRVSILPGEHRIVKMDVSRLPSDTPIYIKAHVYRSTNEGPTVLLIGGIHGDEINGVEIVRRMITDDHLSNIIRGTIIAIPLLNVYGFINSRRGVPDGKDVNRSFPGSRRGSLASQVAACLTLDILPHVDIALDYHTGGNARHNHPQVRYTATDGDAARLGEIFAPPFLIARGIIDRSFRQAAVNMGISVLVYEGGESERLNGYCIEKGINGSLRVMRHLGMIESAPDPTHQSIEVERTTWVRAEAAGMFLWRRQSGARIQRGEVIGTINSPQGNHVIRVKSPKKGYIIGHNNASVVHEGDALFHIAYQHHEEE